MRESYEKLAGGRAEGKGNNVCIEAPDIGFAEVMAVFPTYGSVVGMESGCTKWACSWCCDVEVPGKRCGCTC